MAVGSYEGVGTDQVMGEGEGTAPGWSWRRMREGRHRCH
jgi:hypothetical protein